MGCWNWPEINIWRRVSWLRYISNLELLRSTQSLLKICHSSCLKPGSLTVGKSWYHYMFLGRPLNEPVRKIFPFLDVLAGPNSTPTSPIGVCVCVCVFGLTGAIGFKTTGRVGRGMGWNRSGDVGSQYYRNLGNSAAAEMDGWSMMIHAPIPPGEKGVWKVGLFLLFKDFLDGKWSPKRLFIG